MRTVLPLCAAQALAPSRQSSSSRPSALQEIAISTAAAGAADSSAAATTTDEAQRRAERHEGTPMVLPPRAYARAAAAAEPTTTPKRLAIQPVPGREPSCAPRALLRAPGHRGTLAEQGGAPMRTPLDTRTAPGQPMAEYRNFGEFYPYY